VEARSFEMFELPLKMKAVCFFETRGTSKPDIERKISGDMNFNLSVVFEINFVLVRDILPVFRRVR
jgi:hypothetical protein